MRRVLAVIAAAIMLVTGALGASQKPTRRPPAKSEPVVASETKPASPAPDVQALTNADVIQMVQGGLGEAVVIASIRTAKATAFDVSPLALLTLKKGGVSDAIVSMMIDPTTPPPPAAAAGVAPPYSSAAFAPDTANTRARIDSPTASPEIPREPGIYWDKGRDGTPHLVALEPTVFSQGKTGGFFTSALTYGIAKVKLKAITRGSAAALHIDGPQPTFYFYFESKAAGLGGGGFVGWMSGATSPNEFILARMTSKKNERELIVGEANFLGGSSGARGKDTEDIKIERLSGGIYRVRPLNHLQPGEYCFFYAGGVAAPAATPGTVVNNGKLFDFGIYENK